MPIIVEDGTGLPDSNSYVSVEEATDYATAIGAEFSSDDEASLVSATQAMDLLYGGKYRGTKMTAEQALLFPRTEFTDANGFIRPAGTIPAELKKATIEAAISQQAGVALISNPTRDGLITRKTNKVGDLEQTFEYSDAATSTSQLTKVGLTISPILKAGSSSSIRSVHIVRS
jgi:hypothetical protein